MVKTYVKNELNILNCNVVNIVNKPQDNNIIIYI